MTPLSLPARVQRANRHDPEPAIAELFGTWAPNRRMIMREESEGGQGGYLLAVLTP